MNDYSIILILIGGLTILTNLIVQVIKPLTKIKIPSEVTALLVSEILTLVFFFGFCDYQHISICWYSIAGAIIAGLLVSYSAQFGFDKFKAAIEEVKTLKANEEK